MWLYYSLVTLPLISTLLSVGVDLFNDNPKLAMLDKLLYIEISPWMMSLGILVLVVLMIDMVGLILKKEWARKLYIFTMILSPFGYIIDVHELIYMSNLALMFNDLCYVAQGVLLVILLSPDLYTPIFNKNKTI